MDKNKLIVITGPTAVGKTKVATLFAHSNNGEIISADSRQVYKGMDIGTGKDLGDYYINKEKIAYHLINIREVGDNYFINQYYKDYMTALENIQKRNKLPILCGGSGLYIETALEGNPWSSIPINKPLQKKLATLSINDLLEILKKAPLPIFKRIDKGTIKKIKRGIEIAEYLKNKPEPIRKINHILPTIFVLYLDREVIKQNIYDRLIKRLENGMVDEVARLLKRGVSSDKLKYYGLEYRWVTSYLLGEVTKSQMIEQLNIGIRQFAKRQMTWFRRMEKKGHSLNWLDASTPIDELVKKIKHRSGI